MDGWKVDVHLGWEFCDVIQYTSLHGKFLMVGW